MDLNQNKTTSTIISKLNEQLLSTYQIETQIKNINDFLVKTNISKPKESFEDYFDPKFPRWLSIVLLFIGLFGNTLCLIIFSQKHMRKNSTFIYLAFLSIVDLIVLTLGLGDIILLSYFKLVLRNHSLIICRLVSFLIYAFTHLSSFILASVSIDRAIATNFITFSKIYCKPKMAYKIILTNICIVFIINFHSLIFLGHESHIETDNEIINTNLNLTLSASSQDYIQLNSIDKNHKNYTVKVSTNYECQSEKDTLYDKFLDPYFKWIDLLSYAIIPFFIMGICTFLIVRVLFLSNKRLNKNKATYSADKKKSIDGAGGKLLAKKSNNSRSNKAKHLTYTLITLNCLFFCLVSPLVIVLIAVPAEETVGINKIVINILYLLAYSNHSFNFILYGFSSPPFRETLYKLFNIKTNNNRQTFNPVKV